MAAATVAAQTAQPSLYAAGSLRLAFDEIVALHASRTGKRFMPTYGPSGKLREEIEKGSTPGLFASAAPQHTEKLVQAGKLRGSTVFTRNSLCLMVAPGTALRHDALIKMLLDPGLRLGTSMPGADPAGDYTWELFRNIDKARPGSYALLDAKALKLTGREVARDDKDLPYARVFLEKRADLFISYCTNAVATAKAVPGLAWVRFATDINVAGAYTIGATEAGGKAAEEFVSLVMSPEGQAILERHGFK
ncbi:MAG: substrate-binding domain-containing protein [Proteobacteria bacterium]|nr:substrate-binding domain-containing protein [Pseudomonadota bacterium]